MTGAHTQDRPRPALPPDAQEYLEALHARFRDEGSGRPADYIPELAKSPPDAFALAVATVDGAVIAAGDSSLPFTLQSISKPFTYGLALDVLGRRKVRAKVGVEPTGEAFNSILELEEEVHRPYNPMINAGAIAIAGLLHEALGPQQAVARADAMWSAGGGRRATVDEAVLRSELATGDRNRAIAYLLRHFRVTGAAIDDMLALYYRQCSVAVDVRDLAMLGAVLAHRGVHPVSGRRVVGEQYVRDILALMFTCGMYDSAGRWAYMAGLPAKSGVSGGLLAVVPGRFGLAAYSPRLDGHGHSVRGMQALQAWSRDWRLSLFG